jgi:AcrR family transcriptional regulator
MTEQAAMLDRRQRRRQESIEEILDVAIELMAGNGIAGLSLGEVARQLGIRPPSLYVYFASKHALYDAVFARGAREILEVVREATDQVLAEAASLEDVLLHIGTSIISWSLAHPVYAQLLFWRPAPGFEPTPAAFAPATAMVELSAESFAQLQERGWLRRDVAAEEILRDWTVVIAGITSQHMSNEPDTDFAHGRFTAALPNLVAMFAGHYAAPRTIKPNSRKSTTRKSTPPTQRSRREHHR